MDISSCRSEMIKGLHENEKKKNQNKTKQKSNK